MTNLVRNRCIQGLKEGDVFSFSRTFAKEETEAFGDLTLDYNPVHYDRRWTDAKGFDGLICHGLLVGSMICEFGGQVGWLATGMDFKFVGPVYFGDTITCTVTLLRMEENGRAEAEATFVNASGKTVCLARLTGRLPLAGEQKILQRMVSEKDPTNALRDKQTYCLASAGRKT